LGIDSGYRTLYALKPLPFAPIYGFGALLILLIEPVVGLWPILFQWLAYGALLAVLEGFSGVFSTEAFGKPLWKYHKSKSFSGYTDLWHAAVWGLLAVLMVQFLHPFLLSLLPWLSTARLSMDAFQAIKDV